MVIINLKSVKNQLLKLFDFNSNILENEFNLKAYLESDY